MSSSRSEDANFAGSAYSTREMPTSRGEESPQNCEVLVDRLIALGKPFSMMAYPNRTHSISEGEGTRRHLFELMTRFLEQNLPPGPRE